MFLNKLLFRNKPWLFKPEVQDDTFGRMWFNEDKKESKYNHYQGHFLFKPTGKEIDIFIDSDVEGIEGKQKAVFAGLEGNYNAFVFKILGPLQEKLSKRKSRDILIRDFNAEFDLFAISIARMGNGQQELILSYSSEIHSLPNISITFLNSELSRIDG